MNLLGNLWHGRIGLARTYWLYGTLANCLWGILIAMVTPGSVPAVAVGSLFMAYLFVANVGLWRSAEAYKGPSIWAALGRASAALTVVFVAIVSVGLLVDAVI